MTATTASVVNSKVESIDPNALNRSPSNPPGPVTYEVRLFALAIGVKSSRSASTTAGSTGSSFERTFEHLI